MALLYLLKSCFCIVHFCFLLAFFLELHPFSCVGVNVNLVVSLAWDKYGRLLDWSYGFLLFLLFWHGLLWILILILAVLCAPLIICLGTELASLWQSRLLSCICMKTSFWLVVLSVETHQTVRFSHEANVCLWFETAGLLLFYFEWCVVRGSFAHSYHYNIMVCATENVQASSLVGSA